MFDVICVGSSTVDAFAKTEFCEMLHDKKNRQVIAYPVGAKILVKEMNFTIGGGGTNSAVALSRLGLRTAYLGKMGTKENSKRIINGLKKEKVNTSLIVRSEKARTGYSIVLDSKNHDRTILAFKGSNNDLGINEISLKKLRTKWFYFSTLLGKSYKTLEKLADYAEKNRIKIAFNISSYLAKKGPSYLKRILKKTEILVLNREEASILVGKAGIETLFKRLHKLGPKIISITEGKKGVYVFSNNCIYKATQYQSHRNNRGRGRICINIPCRNNKEK
jgi:ribokinase